MRPVAVVAAAALALAGPATAGAARTASFPGWNAMSADFSGRHLIVSEAATVRLDPARDGADDLPRGLVPFRYYRVTVTRLPLDRARRRFAGAREEPVAVRTHIGRIGPGRVQGSEAGRFVLVPEAGRFAPPVIWCCSAGTETVIHSDGRTAAAAALAAAEDGDRVRIALRGPLGEVSLGRADPAELVPAITGVPLTADPGTAGMALAPGALAWADRADPAALRVAVPSDIGAIDERRLPLGGPLVRVLAADGVTVAVVRRAGRVRVLRVDPGAAPRTVWVGRRVPRIAAGGGAVAVADGRVVLAARAGRLRRITRARGRVAAAAVDGDRLAWLERVRARGERRTVARIARLRR